MKKIYLSLMAIAVAGVTFAQSQRLVVFEEFTQASCPPCASVNPPLNILLNANPTKVVSIKYQTSWPGYDPMNIQNPTEVQTRVTYYNVTGVPNGQLDGSAGFSGQPSSLTQAMINTRYNTTSPLTMVLTHSFSAAYDTINVHAVITKTGAITSTSVKVRFAIIERHISFSTPPGSNGETEFEGVMKKMLPNATGTALATANVGDSMVLDFSWKLTNVYNYSELGVVGFVQDDGAINKEVLQGGYSMPQQIDLDGGVSVAAAGALACDPNYVASFDFVNSGTIAITSADFNYSLNGGATTPYTWNGTLAPGASTSVTLPAITLPGNGTNSLNVSITQVNGLPDFQLGNNSNNILIPTSITSAAAPVTQNYAATTWPPVDWNLASSTGTNWIRSTANTGSAKCDFYTNADGSISDMIAPKIDLTPSGGQTNATLDFDLAYRQFSASYSDELQILVSTDCGATWNQVWSQAGAQLASVTGYLTSPFTPTSTQWKHVWVDMTSYLNSPGVLVNFRGLSNYGNNLYVDNINLHFGAPTGIVDLGAGEYLKIYPNPSNGVVNVDAKFTSSKTLNVTVTDMLGNVVYTNQYAKSAAQRFAIDLTNQSNGAYFVKFENENGIDVQKINILK